MKADVERVWAALHDVDRLRDCLPGACHLSRVAEDRFAVGALVKLGPVSLTVSGTIRVEHAVRPSGYTMIGEGDAGRMGGARGRCRMMLEPSPSGCAVRYAAECALEGPLAPLAALGLSALARGLTGIFVERFCASLSRDDRGGFTDDASISSAGWSRSSRRGRAGAL